MIKTVLEGTYRLNVLDLIKDEINEDTNVYNKEVITKDGRLVIVMYEKYYLRINSDLAVTIIYEENKNNTSVEMIASGGSIGFIRTSYGAENKALEGITEKLTQLGFIIREQTE